MKYLLSLLFFMVVNVSLFSQCTYTVNMQDSYGDGWSGCNLTVNINGAFAQSITLNSGSSGVATVNANTNDIVTFTYSVGSWSNEVSYQISVGGVQMHAAGPGPAVGLAFTHVCGGCDPTGGINTSAITTTSANLSWSTISGAVNYIVEYGPQGFIPGTGTKTTIATSPLPLTGLSPSTAYQVYVRRICFSGDTSIYASPHSFNTLCGTIIAPMLQDFFGTSAPNCWTTSGSQIWRFNTGADYDAAPAGDHTGNNGNYAWVDGSGSTGQSGTLTSPYIDISTLSSPLFSFWAFSHNTYDNTYNTLTAEVFNGTTWSVVKTINTGLGDAWTKHFIDLQALGITGLIQIRFTITLNSPGTAFYNDILIDDVEVKDAPNVSAETIFGLQASYCNASVNGSLVIKNKSGNLEKDVPWAISSQGIIIASGSIPSLAANALDTIPFSIGGVGPAGSNAMFKAYTYLYGDFTPSDDTLTTTIGMSNTGVNAALSSPVGCSGASNGTITAMGHSGVGSYTYLWGANANNQTTNMATGLAAGTYTVTVADAIGCTANATLTLMNPPVLALADSVKDLTCYQNNTGWAMITPNGGVPNFTYAWSNGTVGNALTNATAGSYTVTVTDANGCQSTSTVNINEPSEIIGTITDNTDGTVTANAIGGTAPYTYQWDPAANNQITQTATGLASGIYYVVITDSTGCKELVTIQTVAVLGLETLATSSNLNLYPNPTNSNVFVDLDLIEQQEVFVQIYNLTGQSVFSKNLGKLQSSTIELETADLTTGVYMIQFHIGSEQITKKLIRF